MARRFWTIAAVTLGALAPADTMAEGHPQPGAGVPPGAGACGDGIIEYSFGEQCDDGNAVAGDGCSPHCAVEAALVNRMDAAVAVGASSQNFEAGASGFDCLAADDFAVPQSDGVWEIARVFVAGDQANAQAQMASANLRFYAKDGTMPGAAISADVAGTRCEYLAVVPSQNDGSLMIDLPHPCRLAAGEYFVSAQANQDMDPNHQWYWSRRADIVGDESAWQNPLDGWSSGCTSWEALGSCINLPPGDLMFALDGVVPRCGDGARQAYAGEECDDGNTDDGDGCNDTCQDQGGGGAGHGGAAQGGAAAGPASTGAGANHGDEDYVVHGCGCFVRGRAPSNRRWAALLVLLGAAVALRRRTFRMNTMSASTHPDPSALR
jgi:cysteine-rich repeat protein